jgi:hypothetical protein
VNEALRAGLAAMELAAPRRKRHRTHGFNLGPSLVGSLDNVEGALRACLRGGPLRLVRAARRLRNSPVGDVPIPPPERLETPAGSLEPGVWSLELGVWSLYGRERSERGTQARSADPP